MLKKPHTHICAVPVWKWGHISADSYSTCQVLCFIWSCNYRISVIFSQTLPFKAFQWEYLHVNTAFCPGFAFSFTCLSLFQLSVQLQGVRYFSLFFFYLRGVIMCYVLLGWGWGGFGVGEVKLSLSRQRERERWAKRADTACFEHTKLYFHQFTEVEINMTVAYLFQWLYFWVISRQMTRWGLV